MNNTTSSIITIGREYGSAGRQIGQEVARYLESSVTTKSFWSMLQTTAVFARNYLRIMTRGQLTASCILL